MIRRALLFLLLQPGEVVVQESDLLELSRLVRGYRQGLRQGFRFGQVAGHAMGAIRSTLARMAWESLGSPFPNRDTEDQILEKSFGEDMAGYPLHWPHAVDEYHAHQKKAPRAQGGRDPHGIRSCPRCSGEIAQGSETCEGCGLEVGS